MRRFKNKSNNKNTIRSFIIFIVFFCIIFITFILFNTYSKSVSQKGVLLIQKKLDKVIYQFFTDLITDDVINLDSTKDLLKINKNSKDEIMSVDYDLQNTYKILTNTSIILKNALINLENGKLDVSIYDKYLENGKNGLLLNVPIFLGSNNIFLNNLGPMIPIIINFNGSLLTNIKTKVTNYGLNNALLEMYITIELDKLIITPLVQDEKKFYYDILIGAVVVNGTVPNFYGPTLENNSNVFDVPLS